MGMLGVGVGISNRRQSGGTGAPPPASDHYGLQFSDTGYATYTTSVPNIFTGVLLCCWSRNPQPSGYPYSQWNKSPFALKGADWMFWMITGNMVGTMTQYQAVFNANITIWGGGGDRLGFVVEGTPETQSLDWVWNAWQFQFTGTAPTDLVIMRQWIRLGWLNPFITKELIYTVSEMRTAVNDPTWVPSAVTEIVFGADMDYDAELFDMTKIRVYSGVSAAPTQAELTAMMMRDTPDSSAWMDLASEWVDGAASLVDQSGNGRNPTIVGTMIQGQNSNNSYTPQVYLRQTTEQTQLDDVALSLAFPVAPLVGNHIGTEIYSAYGAAVVVTDNQSNTHTEYEAEYGGKRAAFALAPVETSASTTVTISSAGSGRIIARAFEYVGLDAVTPLDWSATNTTPAGPLTITAPNASTRDNSVGVSVVFSPSGFSDLVVMPYGWNGLLGTMVPAENAGQVRTRFGVAAMESVVWPTQAADADLVGIMVGLRPALN